LRALTILWLAAGAAHADERVVLRFATVAPSGSPWARELANYTRHVESATAGRVFIKWYYDAVAGDEMEQLERLRRGQLDGSGSGQMLCEHLAPSLRVARLPGVFQDRDEAEAVLARLRPVFEKEAHEAGHTIIAVTGLGPSIFFTREPVHTLAELKRVRMWRWGADEVGVALSKEMGLDVVALPLSEAARAYDDRRVDGFLGIPSAALAFQWSAQVKYMIDLRNDYLFGCLVVADRAMSRLTLAEQAAVRDLGARVRERYDDLGRRIDDALIGGLFQKQGLTAVPVSESLRAEYFSAARAARERVADRFVPPELLQRVQSLLADYRAEHPR
jgi:TRAP-type C4-dicarboxylate transport system substrate-binding protein